jgi:hypothetical protein
MKAASTTVNIPTATAVETPSQTHVIVTAEMALYAAIFGVAAVLRLWNLGASLLSTREATQAVAAFNGALMPLGGCPFLFGINQSPLVYSTTVNDSGVR